jgi:hypothetical protein
MRVSLNAACGDGVTHHRHSLSNNDARHVDDYRGPPASDER